MKTMTATQYSVLIVILLGLITTSVIVVLQMNSHVEPKDNRLQPLGPTISTREVIRISYTPVSCCLPLFVAHHRGYFKDEDGYPLNISLVHSPDSNVAINCIPNKSADIVIQQNMSNVIAAFMSDPTSFRCFMPSVETPEYNFDYILVAKNRGINSIKDLKGRNIGCRLSKTDEILAKLYLKKHGIDAQHDVTLNRYQPQELVAALVQGRIDAAITVDPDATIYLDKFETVTIFHRYYRGDILDPYPATCNLVTCKFLQNRGEDFEIIVKGLRRAIDDIENDSTTALQVMAEPTDPGGLRSYVAIQKELVAKVGIPRFSKDYSEYSEQIRTILGIYAAEKVIGTPVPQLDDIFISTDKPVASPSK